MNYNYIQFPLCLLQKTYFHPTDGLDIILKFGIVNFAKKIEYDLHKAVRSILYMYYRQKELLSNSVLSSIEKYEKQGLLLLDEYYGGFIGGHFEPDEEVDRILKIFENDTKFKLDIILNFQINNSIKILGLEFSDLNSILDGFIIAEIHWKKFEAQFNKDCFVSIKVSEILKFKENIKNIELFRGHCAIKSLIGSRNFISSNKKAVNSRMLGCIRKTSYDYFKEQPEFKIFTEKYENRYHIDKLLEKLVKLKFIMFYSQKNVSVIYFSSYMEVEELVALVLKKKKNDNLRQRMKDAALNQCVYSE